jgi:glycerol dehydrogenase
VRAHQRKAKQTAPADPKGSPAPSPLGPRWLLQAGAWEEGAALLAQLPQPLGLVGEAGLLKSFRKPLTGAWLEAGVHLELLAQPDGSDCTLAARDKVLADAKGRGVKALLGFGGGRMLDLAKAAAWSAGWRVATVPSSAATCACATGVAVINEGGAFREVLDGAPPELCLAEGPVLAQAPPRLLAAGMADTLAKWLEWRALEAAPEPAAAQGWALAQQAANAVLERGAAALAGDEEALSLCLEACLPWSAAASNAGQAPAAAAHSLANALSRQAAGRALLHGEAVGLGLLWQEALLREAGGGTMDVSELRQTLQAWGLPVRLPAGLDLERLLADAWAGGETVHLLELARDPARERASLPLG